MIIGNGFVDLFVKTTSEAAYASSLLKGKGDKIAADQAAVDKMRLFLNNIPMKGRIVIGEGEMDEAPSTDTTNALHNGATPKNNPTEIPAIRAFCIKP